MAEGLNLAAHSGLVVQPYRNDQGQPAWVFRCWGTDRCDGGLSLDHSSERSAVRALARHIEEEHGSPPLVPEVRFRVSAGLTEKQRGEVEQIVKRLIPQVPSRVGRS